jgi:hypothetical protein
MKNAMAQDSIPGKVDFMVQTSMVPKSTISDASRGRKESPESHF